jgi:outer membrane protein TolC
LPVDTTLIAGQVVQPIDLANALKLTGARDLDIAVARQRVLEGAADLSQARALWLPSLFYGPTWYRADGQIQTVSGPVQTISRSGLFLGGEAALANTFPGPPPGTGLPSLNGFSSVLRISDAIFEPMAARRVFEAKRAGVQTAINDAMLEVAQAYFDLQAATGRLAIAREAAANAESLSEITGAYARLGQGLEADHSRALTELRHRQKEIHLASGQLVVASANLVRLLVLDPQVLFAPAEPAECIIRLIPDDVPLEDLIVQGLRNRPELANAQELVEAALVRWKQAKLRPFVPSVAVTYGGGGFGGGPNAFFGNFGPRGDTVASLFWELQNFGFTDRAIMRRRAAEHETAKLEQIRVQTQVAADVVAANGIRRAASRQIEDARKTLVKALDSLRLNFVSIRKGAELPRATRPIEVLQPIQALAQARLDYLDSVLDYNRAQFQLKRAIGQQP